MPPGLQNNPQNTLGGTLGKRAGSQSQEMQFQRYASAVQWQYASLHSTLHWQTVCCSIFRFNAGLGEHTGTFTRIPRFGLRDSIFIRWQWGSSSMGRHTARARSGGAEWSEGERRAWACATTAARTCNTESLAAAIWYKRLETHASRCSLPKTTNAQRPTFSNVLLRHLLHLGVLVGKTYMVVSS